MTTLHRGGYGEMITILHRGRGSLGNPKNDYVICARPLTEILRREEKRDKKSTRRSTEWCGAVHM